jgi:Domain of unknown function (DUF4287)/Domain of unknown function (DUF5655)
MARDTERLEQDFIQNAKTLTGHTIQEWMAIIRPTGLDKVNAILNWLKSEHGLKHDKASFLAQMFLNDGQPVFDRKILFAKLFEGKDHLLPLYRALETALRDHLPDDVDLIPTKAYVSIEGKKCFASATLTRQGMRVGIDLGDRPFDAYAQKAKSLGAMPNIGHMVEVSQAGEVDERLIDLLKVSYAQVHSK